MPVPILLVTGFLGAGKTTVVTICWRMRRGGGSPLWSTISVRSTSMPS